VTRPATGTRPTPGSARGTRPRSLRETAARKRLREILGDSGARLLVVLDLDGTLAPIVSRPERAQVPTATLRLLGRAAARPRVEVAILSARPRSDLLALIPVPGVRLIGQYGLEGPLSPAPGERSRIRRAVRRLARELDEIVAHHPGAWVEQKGLSVAVHDRAVRPVRLRALHQELRGIETRCRREGLGVSLGRRITDFVPRGYDKGGALRRLRARLKPRVTLYFGDSPADEPAFAALGRDDFAIRVGNGPTRARYRVRDLGGVKRLLGEIVSLRSRAT
jgi:trehalose 6-phosphate phosphatase